MYVRNRIHSSFPEILTINIKFFFFFHNQLKNQIDTKSRHFQGIIEGKRMISEY